MEASTLEFSTVVDNEEVLDYSEDNTNDEEKINSEETLNSGNGDSADNFDSELEDIKARTREMEDEVEKLRKIQSEVDLQLPTAPTTLAMPTLEEKIEIDNRSIYVGNVDYCVTEEMLKEHFKGCGAINRAKILVNKFNGQPKGFAYVEFAEKDSVQVAMAMDDSLLRGRNIKVLPKRTNRPGMSTTNRPPRGRGSFKSAWGRGRGKRGSGVGLRGRGSGFYRGSFDKSKYNLDRTTDAKKGFFAPY